MIAVAFHESFRCPRYRGRARRYRGIVHEMAQRARLEYVTLSKGVGGEETNYEISFRRLAQLAGQGQRNDRFIYHFFICTLLCIYLYLNKYTQQKMCSCDFRIESNVYTLHHQYSVQHHNR